MESPRIALPLTFSRRLRIALPAVDVVRPAIEQVSIPCRNYYELPLPLFEQALAIARPATANETWVACGYDDSFRVWVRFEVLVYIVYVSLCQ